MVKKISERIRNLRNEKELTPNQLATIFNIYTTTLNRYEDGTNVPNLVMMVKIANYFGVSLDYLVGRTDKREVNK